MKKIALSTIGALALVLFALGALVSGGNAAVNSAAAGDIVINEIMQNPNIVSDNLGEWFELVNVTGSSIDIDGWIIRSEHTDIHTINSGGALNIGPGAYLVLCRDDTFVINGCVTCDYEYSNFVLGNGGDEVILLDGTVEIDRVEYDGGPNFPDPIGKSMTYGGPVPNSKNGICLYRMLSAKELLI